MTMMIGDYRRRADAIGLAPDAALLGPIEAKLAELGDA